MMHTEEKRITGTRTKPYSASPVNSQGTEHGDPRCHIMGDKTEKAIHSFIHSFQNNLGWSYTAAYPGEQRFKS